MYEAEAESPTNQMSKDKIKKKSITQKDNKKDGENKNNNN